MGAYRIELEEKLTHWLVYSPLKSQWINCGPTKVYMRKTEVMINRARSNAVITLANIFVNPRNQGKGMAADVLRWMESTRARRLLINREIPPEHIAVENACCPRMHEILRRHGWDEYPLSDPNGDDSVRCYLKALRD